MFRKILKCKRNDTEILTFEDRLTLEKLHELIPNQNKTMTAEVDHSFRHNHLHLPSTFEFKKRIKFPKQNKPALYNNRNINFSDAIYNAEDDYNDSENEDENDDDYEDGTGGSFTRLVKQMLDTHAEKKIQATEKSIAVKNNSNSNLLSYSPSSSSSSAVASQSESLVFSTRKEPEESVFHTTTLISNKKQVQSKTQTGDQNPLTVIHKTLEKQLQDLSELFQREIINVLRILDYPTASKAMDKLVGSESVGFINALCFIINHITKSIAKSILEKKIVLSTEHINNLRKQFLRLTTSIERLRRIRVKIFSKFNKQIHSYLDLMIQTNDFNLEFDTRTSNLLSLPMSHRVDAVGGFLNEVVDENSYDNLYWGNYSSILSSLREEGNKSSSGKNITQQNKNNFPLPKDNYNSKDNSETDVDNDAESIINKIQVPPGEMEIKWEAWKRNEINCRLSSDTTFEFSSLPIIPNQLIILQEIMNITLNKLQKAEKFLKKATEDHTQSRIILKELSRNIHISNLNAEEIHEILKVVRVSVATTSTFLKCIEKTSRVSRFFISEGILHLRHSIGEITEKKLRALTYKPNYIILLFNIKVSPKILPDENTLNNIFYPTAKTNTAASQPLPQPMKSKHPPSKATSRKSYSSNSSKILNNLNNDNNKDIIDESLANPSYNTTEKIATDENLTEDRIRIPELFSSISKEIVEEQKKDEMILLVKEEEEDNHQQEQQQQQPLSTFFLPPSLTESSSTMRDRKIFADVHVEMEKLQNLILDGISKAYSILSLPNTAIWSEDGKVPQILGLVSILATATTATRPYSEILPIYKRRIRLALIELNMATNLGSRNKDIVQDVGYELARINDNLETMTNLLIIKHSHDIEEKTGEEQRQQQQEKQEQEKVIQSTSNPLLPGATIIDNVNGSCNSSHSPGNTENSESTGENPSSNSYQRPEEQEEISLAELQSLQHKCSLWQIRWDSQERLILKHRKSNKSINFHNMTLSSKCEVLIAMIQFSRIIILTTGEHLKVAKENLYQVNRIFKKIVKSLEKVQEHQKNKKKKKKQGEEQIINNKKRNGMEKTQTQTASTSSSSGSASSSSSFTIGQQVNFTSLVSKVKSTHTEAVHLMGKINATLSQVASILFVVNNYLKLLSNWENYYQNPSSSSSSSSGRNRGIQSLTFQQIFQGKMDEAEEYIRKLYLFPITLYIPLKINPINHKQVVV